MRVRAARPSDAENIFRLIESYAAQGLLLPRAQNEIRANVARFLVLEEKGRVVASVALEPYGADLAEIRSLAVEPEFRSRGLGARLLHFALADARRRRIARVFAVTQAPEFFLRNGFAPGSRLALTEKLERDCNSCSKRQSCRLVAVIAIVIPERTALNILSDLPEPVSAA